jgi:ADP-dependent NAD(P)H-hydrate dehydratase / NAD(P)H-hydrate epimerase
MRAAHTVEQVRGAEETLLALTPQGALMKRAATGLAHAVAEFLGRVYGARVLLVVGAGNNGGDALFAGAALARRGARVEAVLLVPDKAHGSGLAALRGAGGVVVPGVDPGRLGRYDVAVDGIVGIGGSGPLRPDAAAVVAAVGEVPWVAVDVPSGVEVDSGEVTGAHVRARLTVTFGTHKPALLVDPAARACGTVHLVDIGLDLPEPEVEALQAHDVAALLPRPRLDAHKYSRGVVGVRAGSAQYPGAGLLCVAGASTGLAGMVRYVPAEPDEGEEKAPVEALVPATHPEVVLGVGKVQAWVVGSGAGSSARTQLQAALADDVPLVLDADALAVLEECGGVAGRAAVLTPHAGELARVLDLAREVVEAEQLARARQAARRFGCVVMLKSRHTLVADPGGRVRVTTVGPPWLATAGAGDVLAGVVGALLAAGLSPFDAASVGSWVHGAAAAAVRPGGPLVAGEVARAVPEVCARLLRAG